MNLEQLSRKIINNLNDYTADTYVNIVDWINEVIRYVCGIKNWWFCKDIAIYRTVSETPDYLLPDGFKKEFLMVLFDGSRFKQIKISSLRDAALYYGNEKGEPQYYVLNLASNSLSFFPIPDNEYLIKFLHYRFLPNLSKLTDSNILTNNFPDLIEYGVMQKALSYYQRYEEAQFYEVKFKELLKELNTIDNSMRLPQEMIFIPRTDINATSLDENTIKILLDYW